jgi:hypothetical protein
MAAVPWTGVMVLAIVEAIRRWRRDARLRGLLVWAVSVMLPLSVTGNKQPHYLMMVMPCFMVLVGWALDEAIETFGASADSGRPASDEASRKFAGLVAVVFWISASACAVAALGAPLAARNLRGSVRPADFGMAAGIALAMVAVMWAGRGKRLAPAAAAFAAAWALALTAANTWWWPTVEPNNPRLVAAEFRRVAGDGPYCSYGTVVYLPLGFALRSEVPAALDADELREQVGAQPDVHVIFRRKARDAKALPVAGFVREAQVANDEAVFELYRYAGPSR